jgi:LysM repeat protein
VYQGGYKLFRANDTHGLRYYFSERKAHCTAGEIVMGRNDNFEIVDIEEDFTDDEEHTFQNRNEETGPIQELYQKLKSPYAWIGLGLIVFIILIVILFPRTGYYGLERKIDSLDAKLKQVEGNLNRLVWIEARLDQMEEKIKEFEVMMNTLEKFGKLSTQPTAKSPETVTNARYHRVRGGETLYGISRHYGLTVEELRRLNKLPKGATIYAEQKLLISQGDSK